MSSLSPRLAIENLRFPLDSYLYHESIGVVLVGIPKVGCSSLKRWLIAMTNPEALSSPGLAVHKYSLEALALSRLPAAESARILATRPAVAFIREPLQRLRSAFVEKIVRPAPDEIFVPARELLDDWGAARGLGAAEITKRRLTFREFVEHIATAPHDHLDPHWRPQADFLSAGANTVLPLERLSQALDALARRVGRPEILAQTTNVTRKDPVGTGCLADVPAGELHRSDLRPPLSELADPALIVVAMTALSADARLYQRALLTPIPWRAAPLADRYRDGAPDPATDDPSRRSDPDRHPPTEHRPGIAAPRHGLAKRPDAPRNDPFKQ